MISYKDMTFCPFSKDCTDGKECHRAITESVKAGAEKSGLPLAQFAAKPPCYKEETSGEVEASDA